MKIKIKAKDREVHRVQNHEVTEGLRKHFLIDSIGRSSHSSVGFWKWIHFELAFLDELLFQLEGAKEY